MAKDLSEPRFHHLSPLWRLISPYKKEMVALATVSLVSALMEAIFIVILTAIAMALVGEESKIGPVFGYEFGLYAALGVAALALIVRVLFSLAMVWTSAGLVAKVTTMQRRRLAGAFLRTSWAVQQTQPTGQLQDLLTTFVNRSTATVESVTRVLSAGLSLVILLATSALVDLGATGAVVVALLIVAAILTPLRRAIRGRSRQNSDASLKFAKSVSELGALGQEMQTFGVVQRFEETIDRWTLRTTETKRRTQHMQGALPHVYLSLAYAAILIGVAALPILGIGNLGAVGAVMLLMLRSLSYGQQMITASAAIAANQPFLDRLEENLELYEEHPAEGGEVTPESLYPLVAKDLSFSYHNEMNVLVDVSFDLDEGSVIGVIGPSGAGKSTLAQLALGLRRSTGGSLTIGGVDISAVDREWWTQRVAFVAQDALLFTGTVAENIRFFREGISDEDLCIAAQQANFLSEIEKLPQGFATHLGERGSELSGGQKQRLSIARALAGRPQLLLLDEPTSALDGQSEALIRKTLMDLRGSLSIIIIAHRMSTLDICDKIMVLESGEVTGFAPPHELLGTNSFYRRALEVAGIEI